MARNIIPTFRYVDAPGAIAFLCAAFGFERHAVYADDADPRTIHHAQLVLDEGMVMLGSASEAEVVEAATQTAAIYAYVADPDAHCARARAAGAEIVAEPHDNDGYPGRGYAARDPGGYVWSFGSYDPWTA
jgi:uncharacterized glyoxalase superfamily protein PhnB